MESSSFGARKTVHGSVDSFFLAMAFVEKYEVIVFERENLAKHCEVSAERVDFRRD
jgi:hypothetical protein